MIIEGLFVVRRLGGALAFSGNNSLDTRASVKELSGEQAVIKFWRDLC
jgi:hypothetical protein